MPHSNYVQRVQADLAQRLPDCDPDLIALYTLLALTAGIDTTLEDVYDAWAVWLTACRPGDHDIVPFNELAPEMQELGRKYMLAIHKAAVTR